MPFTSHLSQGRLCWWNRRCRRQSDHSDQSTPLLPRIIDVLLGLEYRWDLGVWGGGWDGLCLRITVHLLALPKRGSKFTVAPNIVPGRSLLCMHVPRFHERESKYRQDTLTLTHLALHTSCTGALFHFQPVLDINNSTQLDTIPFPSQSSGPFTFLYSRPM